MIRSVLWVVVALFPVSEVALAFVKRSGGRGVQSEDRGSMRLLWLSIALGIGLAVAAQWIPSARLPGPPHVIRLVALGLLLGGLALRWAAILTLGRLFTVDVAIHSDHVVVQAGLYRLVRHPSYTGLLVAFLGLGVFYANWLSILGLLLPITLAVLNRVAKEEHALLTSLGSEYADYCARNKRFIPGLL
jgi:protein-S-isoprenylcysteine O-methyltransferase Ste14